MRHHAHADGQRSLGLARQRLRRGRAQLLPGAPLARLGANRNAKGRGGGGGRKKRKKEEVEKEIIRMKTMEQETRKTEQK